MTIHDFDMARFLLGEIVEVQAAGANLISEEIAEVGDIDSASIMLRGADGDAVPDPQQPALRLRLRPARRSLR